DDFCHPDRQRRLGPRVPLRWRPDQESLTGSEQGPSRRTVCSIWRIRRSGEAPYGGHMELRKKMSRPLALLSATVIATLTLATVAKATQTISTPNAAFVSYNLAPGRISTAIVPAANQAVLVMGTCTSVGFRGVGQVTMLRIPASFLEWVGLESTAG